MSSHTDRAELVSLFIEAVLYGLYIASFLCTIYVLVYKRSSPNVHYGMFFVTVLMFVLATIHLLINLLHLFDAFNLSQKNPQVSKALFEGLSSFKNLFRSGVILAEIIVGDLVLIYRCYVAWGNSLRVIVLPMILLLGTAVTSGGVVYSLSKAPPGTDIFGVKRLQIFFIVTQVLVFLNNFICTSLLSWRLWRMSRAVLFQEQRQGLRSVARIIAESGLITGLAWIIYIILNATRQPSAVIVLNSLAPITGGAFCLIVSRVALNKDIQKSSSRDTVHPRGDPNDDALSLNSDHLESTVGAGPHAARGRGALSRSILPVLDGGGRGRHHRPMEITVTSRESVRIEMATDHHLLYQDEVKARGGAGVA